MSVPVDEAYDYWRNIIRSDIEAKAKINSATACLELRAKARIYSCSHSVMTNKLSGSTIQNPRLRKPREDICIEIGDLLKQYNCP